MLKVLRHIVQEVNSAETLHDALDIVVRRVRDTLETDACAVFLVDPHHDEFVLMATEGLNQDLAGHLRFPLNKGLVGLIAERKEPVNLEDPAKHERFHAVPGVGEESYKAFLGVPIQYHRRLLGVIIVEQEAARRYDGAQEAFLVTISAQLANLMAEAELMIEMDDEVRLPDILRGIPSSSGVGIGQIVVVYPPADLDAVPDQWVPPEQIPHEITKFKQALQETHDEMQRLGDRLSTSLPPEEHALFTAYLSMLESQSLQEELIDYIHQGYSAECALKFTIKDRVRQFNAIESEYLRERAMDIEDLGCRILANLQTEEHREIDYPCHTILVGNQVSAADLAAIPEGNLVGVVAGFGSSNSHVAILARALGVPAAMGVGELNLQHLYGLDAIVDGYLGQVHLCPNGHVLEEFKALATEEHELNSELEELNGLPAVTPDGFHVALYVNTGLLADIGRSITTEAEGVGLYRTEVPFMIRDRFPSTEEQRVIYRQLLNVFSPRPVVMRTLDIGGDKPLPYFNLQEDNPFLGWRGIRVLLEHPEIFLSQIRAMLRASDGLSNLRIMLPMITDVSEVEEAMRLIRSAYHETKEEGLDIIMPPVGIMVEVPAAVYQARLLAQRVDFLSVGSNDLIQYILAVDRNNSHVANLYHALHPAVLKALKYVAEAVHEEGKMISICGEMASDPAAVILLLGMGFDMFSVSAPSLPRVKWVIRRFAMSRARKLLSEALTFNSPEEIRRHLEFALESEGLGGLIRAGRH